jgi:hypothetical protein
LLDIGLQRQSHLPQIRGPRYKHRRREASHEFQPGMGPVEVPGENASGRAYSIASGSGVGRDRD